MRLFKKVPAKANIRWVPFFLNPNLPGGPGINKLRSYENKFGAERVKKMVPYMQKVGLAENPPINFSYGGNIGNTLDSHRLAHFALLQDESGEAQNKVMIEMFKAYFEKEKALSDQTVLLECAKNAGLDTVAVEDLFKSEKYTDDVLKDIYLYRKKHQVTGVPFFIISAGDDGKAFSFSGAQDADTIVKVLDNLYNIAHL